MKMSRIGCALVLVLLSSCSLAQRRTSSDWISNRFNTQEVTQRSADVPPSNNQVDYRLYRIEAQVNEKTEAIRNDIRSTNRRLQSLEYQSSETQTALDDLKREIIRLTQSPSFGQGPISNDNNRQDQGHLQDLANGVKLVVSALRVLNSDISGLKYNLSALYNATNELVLSSDNLVSKQYLHKELMDIKHSSGVSHRQPSTCVSSDSNSKTLPESCGEILHRGITASGIYRIQPTHSEKSFMVYCDMKTMGGGWTVIQNRYDGSQDFYQNLHEYKYGFGNLGGEFWLGLENIYELTGFEVNELLIEMEDFNSTKATAQYAAFSIGPEVEGYPLKVLAGYYGEAGDSLMYHAGQRFSTKDMDQDTWPEGSCAKAHGGGWWYKSCSNSNLNGYYLPGGELPDEFIYQGMYWGKFRGAKYSLKSSRMLIRPRDALSPSIHPE